MSGETPAAHLARLKATWQAWHIARDPAVGFIAIHRETGKQLVSDTVPGLEAKLMAWGSP